MSLSRFGRACGLPWQRRCRSSRRCLRRTFRRADGGRAGPSAGRSRPGLGVPLAAAPRQTLARPDPCQPVPAAPSDQHRAGHCDQPRRVDRRHHVGMRASVHASEARWPRTGRPGPCGRHARATKTLPNSGRCRRRASSGRSESNRPASEAMLRHARDAARSRLERLATHGEAERVTTAQAHRELIAALSGVSCVRVGC